MKSVAEVRTTGPDATHRRVKASLGVGLEFDARTTDRERDGSIGWNTIEGDVGTSGEVRFLEVGSETSRGDVVMNYSDPPGGELG